MCVCVCELEEKREGKEGREVRGQRKSLLTGFKYFCSVSKSRGSVAVM